MNRATFSYNFLLAIVSPLLSLISLVRTRGQSGKRFLLVVIIVIYGVTLPMTELADGYRHHQRVVEEYTDMSWSRFVDDLYLIITFQVSSSSSDVYNHCLSFFTGAVLGAPALYFFFVSLVYGYFYSGAVMRVFAGFNNRHVKIGFFLLGFISLFLLNKGVEGIQTVRTWTGLWVLFYGVIKITETGDKKYILLLLSAPLIHFGYFIMAIPLYGVLLLGNRYQAAIVIYLFSSIVNFVDPQQLSANIKGLGLAELKFQQYERSQEELTSEAQLERLNQKKEQERTWYKKLNVSGLFKVINAFLVYALIFFGICPRYMNFIEKRLFIIGLAMLAGANVFFFLFAVSNRMNIIGLTFVFASVVMLLIRSDTFNVYIKKNIPFKLALGSYFLLSIPQFIFLLSFFLSQLSVFFFVGPFVPLLDSASNLSAIDFIKNLL